MEMIPAPHTSPAELTVDTVRAWLLELSAVERRIRPRFPRWDARRRAGASLRGVLSPVERKNGWPLAAGHGEDTPYGVQHLLGRAVWDAAAVRDDLRGYVLEPLGTPDGVVVIDETGCLKKGPHWAGGARQDRGTAGRVAHGQRGVFLAYASARGHAVFARALYVPKEGTQDRARCASAGIPTERQFATQPALAQQLLEQACAAGLPATWVTGDSV